jgi:hypothetical protein
MNGKKKVTDQVMAANQANANASTGPKTEQGKSRSSLNPVRHGILSDKVVLETDAKRAEYQAHRRRWEEYFQPQGPEEEFLVDEITISSWKLGITETLESRELARREQAMDPLLGLFESKLELPIDAGDIPIDHGWSCEKLIVRAVTREDNSSTNGRRQPAIDRNRWVEQVKTVSDSQERHGDHLEVEAVLGSTVETLSRYGRALRNNLYRALKELRILRGEERDDPSARHSLSSKCVVFLPPCLGGARTRSRPTMAAKEKARHNR